MTTVIFWVLVLGWPAWRMCKKGHPIFAIVFVLVMLLSFYLAGRYIAAVGMG